MTNLPTEKISPTADALSK